MEVFSDFWMFSSKLLLFVESHEIKIPLGKTQEFIRSNHLKPSYLGKDNSQRYPLVKKVNRSTRSLDEFEL